MSSSYRISSVITELVEEGMNKIYYYALYKILSSNWSNANLSDFWLVGGNVRVLANRERILHSTHDRC